MNQIRTKHVHSQTVVLADNGNNNSKNIDINISNNVSRNNKIMSMIITIILVAINNNATVNCCYIYFYLSELKRTIFPIL